MDDDKKAKNLLSGNTFKVEYMLWGNPDKLMYTEEDAQFIPSDEYVHFGNTNYKVNRKTYFPEKKLLRIRLTHS